MTTAADIAKRALAYSGTRTSMTALSDGTPEGDYAGLLYEPLRDFLLREGDYDFSLQNAAAIATTAPDSPWLFAYTKPSGMLRLRQLVPTTYDPLDPRPLQWTVSSSAILTRVTVTRVIYTAPVVEDSFDSIFTESFTRLLASALSFALKNNVEFSKEKLADAISLAGIANLRDG